ncbi:alcohol dehydrogenase family protein [Candidatus Spongiisocius sp.]|uniref:alcohol dehydrogenase family protein n=1 Tax=Candidatus Spongiisocius sp. TaxID=3101273 RepID=UPI003B5B4835
MSAALLLGVGGPEMLEVRDDVPVPEVAPGEVLVRVAACGVNNTDINTRVGWYSRAVTSGTTGSAHGEADLHDAGWSRGGLAFPRIQGADVVGTVTEVGAGVSDDIVGRRVLVDPWLRGGRPSGDSQSTGYLGSERDGGFAEYCSVPSDNVHPVSGDLSDVELATFPCSWSTAEHMLQRVGLGSGETVAVPGASGGVGSALVQLAKLRGARVVAITSASKRDEVAALGADRIVARHADRVPEDAVEANGGPFHAVADVVGGADFGGWLEALRRGGRYVTSGAIAGPMVELDLRTLYLKDLTLHGATVYQPQVFADLVGYIESGRVRAVVGGVYRLEDIHPAQEAFLAKRHVGSLVIRI